VDKPIREKHHCGKNPTQWMHGRKVSEFWNKRKERKMMFQFKIFLKG
jgi:hypothetical protein